MQAPQVSASLAARLFAAVLTLLHRKLRCQLISRLRLRLPTAFREDKGAHLQASQKRISSHSQQHRHSAASARWASRAHITQHRGNRNHNHSHMHHHHLMQSQRANRLFGASVGRSVGRSCRCAGVLRNAALVPQQTPAAQQNSLTRTQEILLNIAPSRFSNSSTVRRFLSSLRRHRSLLQALALLLRTPLAAHTALRCA